MDRPFAGRTVHPNRRTAAIAIFMAVVLFLYAVRLFQIQVTDAETYAAQGGNAAGITLPIEPTRGEILDRNMNELVVNTTTYTILFDKIYWPSGSSTEAREKLEQVFDMARTQSDFGNGRYVRNLFELAKMNQATRLLEKDFSAITAEDVTTITAEDIALPNLPSSPQKPRIGFF